MTANTLLITEPLHWLKKTPLIPATDSGKDGALDAC